jgi:hypothetical protein
MSRGPGRVQKIITDLIASNPHGAWSVTELCKHIYPDARMEKKHRVAVTRALRKMVLPSAWGVLALWRQGNEYCLYNRCDLESTLRYTYLGWWREAPIDFATWKDRFPHHIEIAENKVSDACRHRDASPNWSIRGHALRAIERRTSPFDPSPFCMTQT